MNGSTGSPQVKNYLIAAAIILALGVFAIWYLGRSTTAAVKNFDDCVTAGYSVATSTSSTPATCQTPQGKLFVEGMATFSPTNNNGVACTMEAKLCPGGSYVGRTGPNCEFASCPSTSSGSSTDNGGVVCAQDVRECSDGSFVNRVAPSCNFAACPSSGSKVEGTLTGKVSIGPLCPVESIDHPCTRPGFYASHQITLSAFLKKTIYINLQEDGSFSAQVPAGTYELNLTECTFMGCSRVLPQTVTIKSNQATEVNLNIDTGIR